MRQNQSFEVVVKYVDFLEIGMRCHFLYPSPLSGPSHPKCGHEITIKSFNIVIATGQSQTLRPAFQGQPQQEMNVFTKQLTMKIFCRFIATPH